MKRLNDDRLSLVAMKLNSDLASVQAAVGRIMDGGCSSTRFKVEGDKPGAQPCGVATLDTSGGRGRLLFFSHRDQSRWTVFLDGAQLSSGRVWPHWKEARGTPEAPREAKAAESASIAMKIAQEGARERRSSFGRDYFQEKGMLPWEGRRYARRSYAWISGSGHASKILAQTPFWIGHNCETGALQCVQGKYSSQGEWRVVTCGSTAGAQVEFAPWGEGEISPCLSVILCEGVSTAWGTLQLLGGRAFVVATLGKGNLARCAVAARARFGAARSLVILADIDANGAGQRAAEEAALQSQAPVLAPFLSCQSSEAQAACLSAEGGQWDGWNLWRLVGDRRVGVESFLRLQSKEARHV